MNADRAGVRCRGPWLLSLVLWSLPVGAAEAPAPSGEAPLAEIGVPSAAEAAYQVAREGRRDRGAMDPAIFTEISPFTAPERALRLPEDQREDLSE